MTGVGPEGENVRKAVQWISDKRQYEGGGPLATLIEEASGRTTHIITIKDCFLDFLPKNHSEEEIVIAVFRFLLDREPKETILTNFDISIIQNYFPKFLSEISPYLCKIKN